MADLETVTGTNFKTTFELFLFNRARQISFQSKGTSLCFNYIDKSSGVSMAVLNFFIQDEKALSPLRAPFGGLETDASLSVADINSFLIEVAYVLKSKGIKEISIVTWPECYAPVSADNIRKAMEIQGYKKIITDQNFHLAIKNKGFEEGLHLSEKRRLVKCYKSDFVVKVESNPNLSAFYELVKLNRQHKGHPLTVDEDVLTKIITQDPEQYVFFCMYDNEKMIAASIGVKINSKILYYYLPGDHPDYASYSPTVMLIAEMYKYCKEKNYETLDLGISTAKGLPNEGLIRFKENLGAELSYKYSWAKEL